MRPFNLDQVNSCLKEVFESKRKQSIKERIDSMKKHEIRVQPYILELSPLNESIDLHEKLLPSKATTWEEYANELYRNWHTASMMYFYGCKIREEDDWKMHGIRAAYKIKKERRNRSLSILSLDELSEEVAGVLNRQGVKNNRGSSLSATTIKRDLLRSDGYKIK